MLLDPARMSWTREPGRCEMADGVVSITTLPHTDLWQRTYYHFRNDTAPVLQMETDERYFSFTVKTSFAESHHRFDQCGIAVYLDAENWLKASVEYEDGTISHLGSVVTNGGWSDWATTEIGADIREMWYRLSRRDDDFRIECSRDGARFSQMRICHLGKATGPVAFGIYAASPEESTFTARFSDFNMGPCVWEAHVGQAPDEDLA